MLTPTLLQDKPLQIKQTSNVDTTMQTHVEDTTTQTHNPNQTPTDTRKTQIRQQRHTEQKTLTLAQEQGNLLRSHQAINGKIHVQAVSPKTKRTDCSSALL